MSKERNDVLHKFLMWLSILGISVGGVVGIIWAASAKSSQLELVSTTQAKMEKKVEEHDKSITTLQSDTKWIRQSLRRIEKKLGIDGDDRNERAENSSR